MIPKTLPSYFSGLRGRLRPDVSLASRCWFQAGGRAEWLFTPEDADDLCLLMRQLPEDVPLFILGVGSNLLVRDGGLEGVVVRLGRGFAGIGMAGEPDGQIVGTEPIIRSSDHPIIRVGAAALDLNVAIVARDHGIGRLEFLSGIPGTIGGALAMNAGAYGREIKDVLVELQAVDERGNLHRLKPEELNMTYRHTELPERFVLTGALLRGEPDAQERIAERMENIEQERRLAQPITSRTGGSTFKNPPGKKAWQLIDEAGCRGLRHGMAQVSEKHCNFLINTGGASADDLESLGEEVRANVKQHSGIELEWEIKRVGKRES